RGHSTLGYASPTEYEQPRCPLTWCPLFVGSPSAEGEGRGEAPFSVTTPPPVRIAQRRGCASLVSPRRTTMTVPADDAPDTLPPDATAVRDEQRLAGLIEQWALMRDQGRDVPVGELCRDCPHLAPALAEHIALLARFDEPTPAAGPARPQPPADAFAGLR